MTVRKRGAGFMADFMVDGVRYRELFDTATAAEAWELAARSALLLGQPVPKPGATTRQRGRTLADVLEEAETLHWNLKRGSDKTVLNARNFVKWAGPKRPAAEALTQTVINDFAKYLLAKPRRDGGKGVSLNTLNKYMSAIAVLIDKANIPEEDRPKLIWNKPSPRPPRFFTAEEELLVRSHLRMMGLPRVADLHVFLCQTGLRPWAEAAKATWSDFRGKTVTVLGKNNTLRTIPLRPEAYEAVQRQPKTGPGPWSDFGDRHEMNRLWERIRQSVPQVADTVWYTCRHTCASNMAIQGVDLRRIQVWMGHLRIEQTLVYAHLMPHHLTDVVDIMEGAANRPKLQVVGG